MMTPQEVMQQYPQLRGSKFEPELSASLDIDKPLKNKSPGELLHSITLKEELFNDNEGRSQHWSKSVDRKKVYLDALAGGLHYRTKPFQNGVTLRITRILGKGQRFWDSDSVLRGSAKELIDALKQSGWFYDDGPQYIANTIGEQNKDNRSQGPAVLIEVFA